MKLKMNGLIGGPCTSLKSGSVLGCGCGQRGWNTQWYYTSPL